MRFSIPFALLLFGLLQSISAQTAGEAKWTKLVSQNSEFSVSLPGDLTVHQDEKRRLVSVLAKADGVSFTVQIGRDSYASQLSSIRKKRIAENFIGSRLSGKAFEGDIFIAQKKIYRVSLYFRTGSGFYSAEILARDRNVTALTDFLSSILIKSTPVFEDKNGTRSVAATVSVDDLVTSREVRDFLDRKESDKARLQKGEQEVDLDVFFSRPVLFLEKGRPRYADAARQNNVQGTVVLQVQFRSDGDVGDIWVSNGPPLLHDSAVQAAKKIKFLPAEIDGKPVDVVREVEYSFSIY